MHTYVCKYIEEIQGSNIGMYRYTYIIAPFQASTGLGIIMGDVALEIARGGSIGS